MGAYDNILRLLKEARGSNEYEQMLAMLIDSFGETITDFRSARQYVMDIAVLPPTDLKDVNCGSPPFVIEDGETNYAVIWADGEVKPLPMGFEIAEDELNVDDDTILMSIPAPRTPSGLIRFVPVKADFKMPDDDEFEFERIIKLEKVDENLSAGKIEELKETALDLVESEPAKAQIANLIEQLEEAAGEDAELLEQLLQNLVEQGRASRAERQAEIDEKTPLVQATMEGDVSEITRLLKEGADTDVGPPAFVYAIVANQPKAFEVYVKHGIDVSRQFDWENPDGSNVPDVNAFILAAAGGVMWAVKRLLDLGVDPNVETSIGQTALEIAITGGQNKVVDILFEKMSDVSRPSAGRVLVAAAMAGNTQIASRCLKVGIPVDAIDNRGWTALKYAVSNGNLETAKLLLEHGADSNIADDEEWTPLITAIENRDLDLVNLLLSKGADPNTAPEVEDESDQKGFSALMRAAHYGEAEILDTLIAAGAELTQTDSDGAAAVHYAAVHRHRDCLEILLNHGADPNAIAADGYSPIGWFLVGLGNAIHEEVDIDEAEAIKTLKLLINNGASWQEAANKIVANVGDDQITHLDAATLAIKEQGLNKLSATIARLTE